MLRGKIKNSLVLLPFIIIAISVLPQLYQHFSRLSEAAEKINAITAESEAGSADNQSEDMAPRKKMSPMEKTILFQKIRIGVIFAGFFGLMGYLLFGGRSSREEGDSQPVDVNKSKGDPLADKISWSPLKGGGANFRTHRLVEKTRQNQLQLKTSGLFKAISLGFSGVGSVIILYALSEKAIQGESFAPSAFMDILKDIHPNGFIFLLLGLVLYRFLASSSRFDGVEQVATVGGKKYTFDQFGGLQIVSEMVSSKQGLYTSYELNLVLKDGNRVNLADHADLTALLKEGRRIADFIGVPLWVREAED